MQRIAAPLTLVFVLGAISVLGGIPVAIPCAWAQFRDVTPGQAPETAPPAADTAATAPEPMAPVDAWPTGDAPAPHVEASPAAEALTIEQLEETLGEQLGDPEDGPTDFSLRPMPFRGITVGEASIDQLLEAWGAPFKIVKSPGSRIIKYRIPPFRQIDVTTIDDTVVSILIHLDDVLDAAHCARQLRLTHLEPVPIPDQEGNILGLAFPERGVLFGFEARDPENMVAKIQLESVNPEPFALRAAYDFDQRFDHNLEDLGRALELSPRYAQAHWLRAKVLAEVGRFTDALEAAEEAVHLRPDEPAFQLTRADILRMTGDLPTARREAEAVLSQDGLPAELRAYGQCLLGDLLAMGAEGDYKQAMEHHLQAVELAATLASERDFQRRRLAKKILIRAHLAVARDISLGDFQRQETVVPKWLARARALVEELVERDQGDASLRLDVHLQTLATLADLRLEQDPREAILKMLSDGNALLEACENDRNRSRLEWKLGAGLAEAVRLQRLRGDGDKALELADEALVLLQQSAKQRQSTPDQRYLVGRLYFHVGSLHAVHRDDHAEATAWYEKAAPLLSGQVPPSVLADPGTHGEMFVSMGVSYWQTAAREKAISLTEQGTDILQKAVVSGKLQAESLNIPYGNLAAMHKEFGNESEASAFAELAGTLPPPATQR